MKNSSRQLRRACVTTLFLAVTLPASAPLQLPTDDLVALTESWKGERYPDGRPKVPDDIVRRMRDVSIEEAWDVLRKHGYTHQFAGDWKILHEDVPVVGRALTALYLPSRPDLAQHVQNQGR